MALRRRVLEQLHISTVAKRKSELTSAGVDVSLIPEEEVQEGSGPSLTAFLHWVRTLARLRSTNVAASIPSPSSAPPHPCLCQREADASNLEELLGRILEWRRESAKRLSVAPVSVLSEAMARQLAYAQPTHLDALHGLGIRISTAPQLWYDAISHCFQTGFTSEQRDHHYSIGNLFPNVFLFQSLDGIVSS